MSLVARLLFRGALILVAAYVFALIVTTEDPPPSLDDLLHEHDGEPETFLQ